MDKGLSIDLRVLCDILDVLCGALVLAQRLRAGSLDGVVLPYGWLTRLMERLGDYSPQDVELLSHYLVPFPRLLEQLYSVGPDSGEHTGPFLEVRDLPII